MACKTALRRLLIAATLSVVSAVPAVAGTPAEAAARSPWTSTAAAGCGPTAQVLVPTAAADSADPAMATAMSPARRSLLAQIKASGVQMQTSASCRERRPGQPAPKLTPAIKQDAAARPDGVAQPADASPGTSSNWSGFVNHDGVNYTQVTMAWTVPTAKASAPGEYHASIWPGIGSGDSASSALIQDGTDQDAYCNTAGCSRYYSFWYEVYPAESSKTVSGLSVHAGDKVQTSVIYDPGNKSVLFFFVNATTQKGLSITQSVSGLGNRVDQSQVEWIIERPKYTSNHEYSQLTNFGTLTLSQVQYMDSSYPDWVPGGYSGSQDQITMTNCARNQNLAVPYGWTSNLLTFYDVWVNAGKWEGC